MPVCPVCKAEVPYISRSVGECYRCAAGRSEKTESNLDAHRVSRERYFLPPSVPVSRGGATCSGCGSGCRLAPGGKGFCGLRAGNETGGVTFLGKGEEGIYEWYFDPLPTNCVADWVCPAGTGAGYPRFAHSDGPEHGFFNLAVFMGGCSFNCLFCQNSSHKNLARSVSPSHPPEHIARILRDDTACICYFGGDPAPQADFVIEASERALDKRKGKILRICLETNGSIAPGYLKKIMDLVTRSGGCMKVDLKAWSETLFEKLTGQRKAPSFRTFERAASYVVERPVPPPLVASTLLVPGYVEAPEVEKIARFIASLDPSIPYSLLAFYPRHMMKDLPRTPLKVAEDARKAAQDAGLTRVRIGNVHLLW